MINIKKTISEDFEKIYPLLLEFNNQRLTKEDWKKLFKKSWSVNENYFGYTLYNDDEVIGFIGLIFSCREVRNELYNFCNITSWIVKTEYHSYSLLLLFEVLKLKNYILTNFTPSLDVYKICTKLNFKVLDKYLFLVLPLPNILNWQRLKFYEKESIINILDEVGLTIFNDHKNYNCDHIAVEYKKEICYLIIAKVRRKNLPFIQIHFISNQKLFCEIINILSFRLCTMFKACGILVYERYMENCNHSKFKIKIPIPVPMLFYSTKLDRAEIDTLYSELFVLNHINY